jgi:hypothetical protein
MFNLNNVKAKLFNSSNAPVQEKIEDKQTDKAVEVKKENDAATQISDEFVPEESGEVSQKMSILQKAKNWTNENISGDEKDSSGRTQGTLSGGMSNDTKIKLGAAAVGAASVAALAGCTQNSGSTEYGKMEWQTHSINDPKLTGFSHGSSPVYSSVYVGTDDNGVPQYDYKIVGHNHSFSPKIKNEKVGTYDKPRYLPPKHNFMGPKVPKDKEVTLEWEEPVMEKKNLGNIPRGYYTQDWFGFGWASDSNRYTYDDDGNLIKASHGVKAVHRNTPVYNSDGSVKMKDVEKTFMVDEGCKGLDSTSNLAVNMLYGAGLGLMLGAVITSTNKVLTSDLKDDTEEQLAILDQEYAKTQEAKTQNQEEVKKEEEAA